MSDEIRRQRIELRKSRETTEDFSYNLRMYARFLEDRCRGVNAELGSITPRTSPETWSQDVRDLREACIRETVVYRAALSKLYELFPGLKPENSALDRRPR